MLLSACVAGCVSVSVSTSAQTAATWTLEQALARARDRGPQLLVARARVDEARARLAGARVRLRENPVVDAWAGPRSTPSATLTDLQFGISQTFETGGRRAARIEGAEAGVAHEQAAAQDAGRLALRDVATTFFQILQAQERVRLLQDAERNAGEVLRIAQRRFDAGDIAILDVNVARAALARTRAQRRASEGDLALARGELKGLLGLPAEQDPACEGTLRLERRYDLGALLAGLDERPDFQAFRAEIRDADADVRLGRGFQRPDVGVGLQAKREEGNRIIFGGLTVSLPTFNRGQELQAAGAARAVRLRAELDAARLRAQAGVRATYEAWDARRDAVEGFERDGVSSFDENERLAQRSFEVGQISLPDVLLIRRETLDARLDYLDRLLEAAVSVIELESAAGVLR
jgi:cobalt-zinc-cadmium efflux system outer membrane protein